MCDQQSLCFGWNCVRDKHTSSAAAAGFFFQVRPKPSSKPSSSWMGLLCRHCWYMKERERKTMLFFLLSISLLLYTAYIHLPPNVNVGETALCGPQYIHLCACPRKLSKSEDFDRVCVSLLAVTKTSFIHYC